MGKLCGIPTLTLLPYLINFMAAFLWKGPRLSTTRGGEIMKFLRVPAVLVIILAGLVSVASAASSDSLFVNLSTNDHHKANMAIAMSKELLKHGHPVTIYINSEALQIVNTKNTEYAMQQKKLGEFINQGGTVLVCPVCEKFLHVNQADLVPGVRLSNIKAIEQALFGPNTKTLSW
jgi:predicted peroxiredoxin